MKGPEDLIYEHFSKALKSQPPNPQPEPKAVKTPMPAFPVCKGSKTERWNLEQGLPLVSCRSRRSVFGKESTLLGNYKSGNPQTGSAS